MGESRKIEADAVTDIFAHYHTVKMLLNWSTNWASSLIIQGYSYFIPIQYCTEQFYGFDKADMSIT